MYLWLNLVYMYVARKETARTKMIMNLLCINNARDNDANLKLTLGGVMYGLCNIVEKTSSLSNGDVKRKGTRDT